MGVALEPRVCQVLSAAQVLVETRSLGRIRIIFFAIGKDGIVFVELRFEHSETIELREQNAGRFTHRTHGVFRVCLFPGFEIFCRSRKIQVVEAEKPIIQPDRWYVGKGSGSQYIERADCDKSDSPASHNRGGKRTHFEELANASHVLNWMLVRHVALNVGARIGILWQTA